MSRRTLTILVVTLIAAAFATAAIASAIGGSDSQSHTMPNGQTMDGADMGR